MILLPGAVWRGEIPNRTPGDLRRPALGCVLHITGSSYSAADGWFHNPSARASAHLIIDVDGTIYQEVAFDDKAWAEAAGNPFYYSFETVGISTDQPLTNAQVVSAARAYRFLADLDGIPYVLAEAPGQRGFGWHGMGGTDWGGHPYCPGEPRKRQRPLILQLAQGGSPPQEEDMAHSWEVVIYPGQKRWINIPPPFEGYFSDRPMAGSVGVDTFGAPPIPARLCAGRPGGWYAPPAPRRDPKDATQVTVGTGRSIQWPFQKGDQGLSIVNEAAPYDPAHPELGPNLSFLLEVA